jgi:HlyD family secretion protein
MIKIIKILSISTLLFSCSKEVETTKVREGNITESVYASGIVKSSDQYQVFSNVSGIIEEIFISEGDEVKNQQVLVSISNESSKLARENAQLTAKFNDYASNSGKLNDFKLNIEFAKTKFLNDSLNFERQKSLFEKKAVSKFQLEQSELLYQNSKTNYNSAKLKYLDLKKQLNFSDQQAKQNLKISQKLENDFLVKSEIPGKVYSILKEKGEMVSPQTPIAVIGNAKSFYIELQVDEIDIVRIKKGQRIILSMDSYKNQTFEAQISKINPILNERSKTFTVEAIFKDLPPVLFPNLSLEANVILLEKKKSLLIPRKYLLDDSFVLKSDGSKHKVKTGLMDFEKVEILSGLKENEEIILPTE